MFTISGLKAFSKDDVFAMMVANAPRPTEDDIKRYMSMDRCLNPYNDSYKPHIRSREEIIADAHILFASMQIARMEKYDVE